MALSDLTFKLYTDSGLTALFGGTYELTHESDFSDNPRTLSYILVVTLPVGPYKPRRTRSQPKSAIPLHMPYPTGPTAATLALGVS